MARKEKGFTALPARYIEFFEGNDGRLSMMRLTVFMSFFPASAVLLWNINNQKILPDLMLWYLGAFVSGYIGGKTTDIWMKPKGKKNAPRMAAE